MSLLDQFSRSASQFMDRARFETEKFQRTSQLQSDIGELRYQINTKLAELGQRAYELHRAGQISAPSVAALIQAIDQLHASVNHKEAELQTVQAQVYVEPDEPPSAQPGAGSGHAHNVPVDEAPPPPPRSSPQQQQHPGAYTGQTRQVPPVQGKQPGEKSCPACGFVMPGRSVFCPNCGFRVEN